MDRTLLHLVDRNGKDIAAETQDAVKDAFEWAVREYPKVDDASLAGWAEELGEAMAARPMPIEFPRRYAYAALKGKIHAWFRKHPVKEITIGIGAELEQWVGLDRKAPIAIERVVLFEQIRTMLNERDKQILMLLLQDITSPRDVASALGIRYQAAAKATQRVRERMASILSKRPTDDLGGNPPHLCKSVS